MIEDLNRDRRAFSLIELVAALALATFLTLAVLGAMRSMAASVPAMQSASKNNGADARLADLIRFDLQQAAVMRQADGTLYLAGYSSLDHATLTPTHRPVLVAYSEQAIAGRNWLVRQQTALDVLSTRGTWTEFAAADAQVPVVTAISVVPIAPPDEAQSPSSTQLIVDKTPYVFQRLRMQPMPEAVRVMIGRGAAPTMEFTLFAQ